MRPNSAVVAFAGTVPVRHRCMASYGNRGSCGGLNMEDTSWARVAALCIRGQELLLCAVVSSRSLLFPERGAGGQAAELWAGRHAARW